MSNTNQTHLIVKHNKREQWGYGMIMSMEKNNIHIQWEDGKYRKFRSDLALNMLSHVECSEETLNNLVHLYWINVNAN